jgi:hypothetical protein
MLEHWFLLYNACTYIERIQLLDRGIIWCRSKMANNSYSCSASVRLIPSFGASIQKLGNACAAQSLSAINANVLNAMQPCDATGAFMTAYYNYWSSFALEKMVQLFKIIINKLKHLRLSAIHYSCTAIILLLLAAFLSLVRILYNQVCR